MPDKDPKEIAKEERRKKQEEEEAKKEEAKGDKEPKKRAQPAYIDDEDSDEMK
jgi:hypothetical protein